MSRQLLAPTRFVQFDDKIWLIGFKIGRRVVESQMSVFADSNKRDIDRMLGAFVRLYSEGVVVDSWDPAGPGYMDGNSYVFPIRRGPVLTDVRISGTFSVEGVKQTRSDEPTR